MAFPLFLPFFGLTSCSCCSSTDSVTLACLSRSSQIRISAAVLSILDSSRLTDMLLIIHCSRTSPLAEERERERKGERERDRETQRQRERERERGVGKTLGCFSFVSHPAGGEKKLQIHIYMFTSISMFLFSIRLVTRPGHALDRIGAHLIIKSWHH